MALSLGPNGIRSEISVHFYINNTLFIIGKEASMVWNTEY